MMRRHLLAMILYILCSALGVAFAIYCFAAILLVMESCDPVVILANLVLLAIESMIMILATYLFALVAGALKVGKASKPLRAVSLSSSVPKVAILVPVCNTNPGILEETLRGVLGLDYPRNSLQVIIGDNSTKDEITQWGREWCREQGWLFIHTNERRGFKAGLLNRLLLELEPSVQYVVLFDSDHIPRPNIIPQLLDGFKNERVAYVQAKTHFRNTTKSLIGQANGILHSQFFEVFERSKNLRNAALFNGTTAAFRSETLIREGGFQTETFTEDIDTTIHLLIKGYMGYMIDVYGSDGLVPENLEDQISQLWRWAHGATMILRKRSRQILRSPIPVAVRFELLLNAFIFPAGLTSTLLGLWLAIMSLVGIPLVRPIGMIPISMELALLLIGHAASAVIAVYWESEYPGSVLRRQSQLLWFYLLSLCAFPFLVSAMLEGFLGFRGPMSVKAQWNRKIHFVRDSGILFMIGLLLVVIGVLSLLRLGLSWGVILGTGIVFCVPFPLYYLVNRKTRIRL
jgi:cellulose synthase/poly-beta-1,6-N-acetylglucosamine synthase-like glycosyltransferase